MSQTAPMTGSAQALELRRGEAQRGVVVAADELDQEALEPRDHEVEGEQHAGPHAVAQLPEHVGHESHDKCLVDRSGVDRHARRRRHGPVRIAHRPRPVPGPAVVAVAGDLAADPPDRVAQRQPGPGHVEQRQREEAAPPRPRQHEHHAAGQAAVPDEAAAAEDVAQAEGLVVLDQPVARARRSGRRPAPPRPSRRPSPPAGRARAGAGRPARPTPRSSGRRRGRRS